MSPPSTDFFQRCVAGDPAPSWFTAMIASLVIIVVVSSDWAVGDQWRLDTIASKKPHHTGHIIPQNQWTLDEGPHREVRNYRRMWIKTTVRANNQLAYRIHRTSCHHYRPPACPDHSNDRGQLSAPSGPRSRECASWSNLQDQSHSETSGERC